MKEVFVTGGTGYLGRPFIEKLCAEGPGSIFVHMVGAPAPWKAAQFRAIDFVSLEQSVAAAKPAAVAHFVFVSVAHPAPVMKAYTAVRARCEQILRESGINATILRP